MTYKDTKKKVTRLKAMIYGTDTEFDLDWSKGSICDETENGEWLQGHVPVGKQSARWGNRDYTRLECDKTGPFGKYSIRVQADIDSSYSNMVKAEIIVLSDLSKELEDWMKDTLMQEVAATLAPFYKWVDKAMVAAVGFKIEPRCHICMSTIKSGKVVKCECGKTFHAVCCKNKQCLHCGRQLPN